MGIESPYVTVSYRQLSDLLGISYNATIQRVKRNKSFIRMTDNHGNVTLKIPRDSYNQMTSRVTKSNTRDNTNDSHLHDDELQGELKKLLHDLDNLRTANDRLKGENTAIRQKLAVSETSLNYEQKDNARLTGKLQEEQTAKRKLINRIDSLTKDYENLKQAHEKLKNRSWWRRLFNVP